MTLIERDAHLIKKSLNEYHEIKDLLKKSLNISDNEKELMILIGIDKNYAEYIAELKDKVQSKELFFTAMLEEYVDLILEER